MTTPAMPTTATADDPIRCGMVLRLSQLTAKTWVKKDIVYAFLERIGDLDPHGARGRQ